MFHLISSLILLLPLLLVPFFAYKWLYTSSTTSKKQPPSPRKLPVLGNLHQLGLLPHRSLQKLSQKYGPLMLLHLGSVPVLVASSADAAREIMKTHDLIFSNRPKISYIDTLFYGSKEIVFAPYGEYWRQVRSICVLHLLSNKRVQSFRNVREEETSLMIEEITKLSSSSSLVNLTELFTSLTSDIMCRTALGRKYGDGETGRKFKSVLGRLLEILGTFNIEDYIPWLAWVNSINGFKAKVHKSAKDLDELLEGVLEEHRRKKEEEDGGDRCANFLDILLEIQKENALGFLIGNETIKAVVWDMFSAGTETTQTTLNWVMSELFQNPKAMQKLQDEVRQIARQKSEIYEEDLVKMQYLKAVIKETFRIHPAAPLLIPREATQNVELMGYEIKAGTQIFVNAWAIGRDPLSWENPEKFQPERFLDCTIDFKGFNFELIPFGGGRRGCPGIRFAITLMELALAKLVHKFDFEFPRGLKGEDLDMTETGGLTIQRKSPLVVIASPHSG